MAFLLPRHPATYVNNRAAHRGSLYFACKVRVLYSPGVSRGVRRRVGARTRGGTECRAREEFSSLRDVTRRLTDGDECWNREGEANAKRRREELVFLVARSSSRVLGLAFAEAVACSYLPSLEQLIGTASTLSRQRDKYSLFKIPVLVARGPR